MSDIFPFRTGVELDSGGELLYNGLRDFGRVGYI
jgi:hypothetical protein